MKRRFDFIVLYFIIKLYIYNLILIMKTSGQLTKMLTEFAYPIEYYLPLNDDVLMVNQLIGKEFHIKHISYQCFHCKKNKVIFAMGYCYDCFNIVPQTNPSILKPELSTAHLDIEEKDLEWEKETQLKPHIVYLANTGGIKVGVTRKSQIPTRWIDQGAIEAIKIAETENRYLAGISEIELAKVIADKTNYRKMLSNTIANFNLVEWKHKMFEFLPDETKHCFLEDDEVIHLHYPIQNFPTKITSISLKKQSEFSGKLAGIKGQYLIFENGLVFNIRNHEGYVVNFEIK